jgi:Malonate decarboxylase, alpha subunit, transporter
VVPDNTTALLEAVIRPGDRICLEGDNQKQADFLAACLAKEHCLSLLKNRSTGYVCDTGKG